MDEELVLPHKLTLEGREKLTATGVMEIVGFEENAVLLKTPLGLLTVLGRELVLKTLSGEGGTAVVTGKIGAMEYEEPRSGGFWQRLWR